MSGEGVALHALTFVEDGDTVVIGREETESYAIFPVDGAELLRRLHAGSTLDDAVSWYESTYHETLDVEDFLDTLRDLGFLRQTGDRTDGTDGTGSGARPVGLQRLGRAMFGPAAWTVYALLACAAGYAAWRTPAVRPTPSHVFFTGSLVVVSLVVVATEVPLMFLHEAFHVLAGRRLGVRSRLSVGRRLYFVVFQTTMTALLGVPRRRRYLPLVAGMVADVLVLCGLVLLAEADLRGDGSLSVVGRAAVAVAYFTVIRFVWQFLFFLETDIHHVLATALGRTDLRGMTSTYLRTRLWRLLRRPERAPADPFYSPGDLAVLRWFAPLTAVACVLLVGYAAAVVGPVFVGYVTRVADGLSTGVTDTPFWDALVSLLWLLGQAVVILVLTGRDRRRARRSARPA